MYVGNVESEFFRKNVVCAKSIMRMSQTALVSELFRCSSTFRLDVPLVDGTAATGDTGDALLPRNRFDWPLVGEVLTFTFTLAALDAFSSSEYFDLAEK